MAEQQKLRVTRAQERRKKTTFLHPVSPDLVVRIRKISMTTMVMENLIPFHLLKAAEGFATAAQEVSKNIAKDSIQGGADALAQLPPEMSAGSLEFLRHYASVVVIEPKIVLVDDKNPEHLLASELDAEELMSIFYAMPPREASPDDEEVMTPERAQDFRGQERQEPVPADVSPREDVREASELVDLPEREAIHA